MICVGRLREVPRLAHCGCIWAALIDGTALHMSAIGKPRSLQDAFYIGARCPSHGNAMVPEGRPQLQSVP